MDKNIFTILLFAALAIAGCKNQNGRNTAGEHTHSENCSHSHEGHSHEGHCHEDEDGHGHEAHEEHHEGEIKFTEAQAKAVGLETETVAPAPFRATIHTGGKIQPLQGNEQKIVAASSGVIFFTDPSISEGTQISKGEKIASVTAGGLQDGDPVVKAKVAFETAEKEYRRAEKLVADRIISAKEFEQARMNYETARAAYVGQAANLSEHGVALKSQASGFISGLYVGQGEYVTVGQTIATVVSSNRVQLRADLPESHFRQLARIKDANFRPAYEDGVFSVSGLRGRVVSCGRSVSDGSAYIPVTFEFENRENFIPGAFADVWLLTDTREDALSVPVSALCEDQGIFAVYVKIEDEAYMRKEVTTGQNDGRRVEILGGLAAGDEVVVSGAQQVKLASASTAIPGHTHNH